MVVEEYAPVHSTSWKFTLHFVYVFRTYWDFQIRFCSPVQSFNRNILTSLHLKLKAFAHAQTEITHYYILLTNFLT